MIDTIIIIKIKNPTIKITIIKTINIKDIKIINIETTTNIQTNVNIVYFNLDLKILFICNKFIFNFKIILNLPK